MNKTFIKSILAVLLAIVFAAMTIPVEARGGRGGGGRGGGGRGGGGLSRGGGFGGGARPSGGFSRPSSRPMPSTRPSTMPSYPRNTGLQTPRTNIGGGTYNRPSTLPGTRPGQGPGTRPGYPSNRPPVNTGNINIGNSVNVDGSGWGWGGEGYWGAAALGAVTGAAIAGANQPDTYVYGGSTYAYSLPSGCTPVVVDGVTYQSCGGVYYQPTYQGDTVVYQEVSPY